MLTDQEINELLYSLPDGITGELLQELDLEYIPKERIEKLIYIIKHRQDYKFRYVYQAGCLLCYWGVDNGFQYIYDLLISPTFEEFRNNYLCGEDYKYMLGALQYYLSEKINDSDYEIIRKKIYLCIKVIINMAKITLFSISYLYYDIEAGHIEYLPLVRDYLSCIVKNKEHNYWNINDASEILFKYYPEFVKNILKENNITLTHCNFKQNRWEKFIKELEELKQYHNHNK